MIVKSVKKNENNSVTFVIQADKTEFEPAVNRAYLKNKKNIAVSGFRKGKAPRMVIEGMYGADVFYDEAVEELSPTVFAYAVKQENLRMVGRPTVTDYNVSDEKMLTLTIESALYPDVTLGEYKGLSAEKDKVEVSDEDIAGELARVQQRNVRIEAVERAAKDGDTTVIDFVGSIDGVPFEGGAGEKYSLTLGSGTFIPGFEEQVVGLSAGEEKDIDITFPEEYHEELAGKAAVFHVAVKEVRENILPELDDEFAKDVSEFDTLEEYKNSIAENLKKTREEEAASQFNEKLLTNAIENMTAEIPDAMIDEKLDNMLNEYAQNLAMQGYGLEQYLNMMGMDLNMFRASARNSAEQQVKVDILLEKIAETEGFEPTEEEISAEYERIAQAYNVDLQTVKEAVIIDAVIGDMNARKAVELIYSTGVEAAPEKPNAKKKPAAKAAEKETEKTEEETTEKKATKTTAKKAAPKTKAKAEKAPAEEETDTEKTDAPTE